MKNDKKKYENNLNDITEVTLNQYQINRQTLYYADRQKKIRSNYDSIANKFGALCIYLYFTIYLS